MKITVVISTFIFLSIFNICLSQSDSLEKTRESDTVYYYISDSTVLSLISDSLRNSFASDGIRITCVNMWEVYTVSGVYIGTFHTSERNLSRRSGTAGNSYAHNVSNIEYIAYTGTKTLLFKLNNETGVHSEQLKLKPSETIGNAALKIWYALHDCFN